MSKAEHSLATESAQPASSTTFLRLSAGTVYFFFGFQKFFPDLSPAELLAGQSIMKLSMGMLDASTALFWLAILECLIGVSFLFNICVHWLFFAFMAHQASTFLPLFMFPEICFRFVPFAPTLEGQYIFKNLISVAAGWTVMFPAVKKYWSERGRQQPQPQPEIQLAELEEKPVTATIELQQRAEERKQWVGNP